MKTVIGQAEACDRFADISWLSSLHLTRATEHYVLKQTAWQEDVIRDKQRKNVNNIHKREYTLK